MPKQTSTKPQQPHVQTAARHLAEHRLPFRLMLESTTSTTLLR